jgi:hypothetical protein
MTSDYIWSREKLRQFLEHSSEDIRTWATERILILYPDLKDDMLMFLEQAAPEVASDLLDNLQELPLEEKAIEPLLQFFLVSDQLNDKAKAAGLLATCGHVLPDEELEKLSLYDLAELALNKGGFQFFLRRLLSSGEEKSRILLGLAYGCSAEDYFRYLSEEKDDPKCVKETLEDFEKQWKVRLPALDKTKNGETALRWLEECLQENDGWLPVPESRFYTLIAEIDQTQERLRLLAIFFR